MKTTQDLQARVRQVLDKAIEIAFRGTSGMDYRNGGNYNYVSAVELTINFTNTELIAALPQTWMLITNHAFLFPPAVVTAAEAYTAKNWAYRGK
jgi:hypothetical protein